MIITIGGLAGTGTTTAAKVLSEKLDVPFVSAGSIFRDMAKERGMSVLSLVSLLKIILTSIRKLIKDRLILLNLQKILLLKEDFQLTLLRLI